MHVCVHIMQGGQFGNGAGGGGESPLGGLGGSVAGTMSTHKHMLQAQPSLRDPSKGMSLPQTEPQYDSLHRTQNQRQVYTVNTSVCVFLSPVQCWLLTLGRRLPSQRKLMRRPMHIFRYYDLHMYCDACI